MKEKKITKNYLLNVAYNILTMLVPLVTTPYISRVLGAENLGIYSYCLSIQTYFIIAGTLGIPIYAKKKIATIKNSQDDLNRTFSEFWVFQLILITLATLAYLIVVYVTGKYTSMFMVCAIGIIAANFDVSWLYAGIEDFQNIVIRNVVVKLLSVALIFILVKSDDDLIWYGICIMGANFIGNLWMYISAFKYVSITKVRFENIIKSIGPSVILLLPYMVTTVNQVIDKTMMGMLTDTMAEVGFYEQALKIITLSVTVVTSLGTVLMPRLARLYSSNKRGEFKMYVRRGIDVVCFISLPLVFGCFAISTNLVPWFYGNGYEKVQLLLKLLAPLMFFLGFNDLVGAQVYVSVGKEKKLFVINIIGMIVNIMLNYILIKKFLSYGAAVATVISELVKSICFCIDGRDVFSNRHLGKTISKYGITSILMCILIMFLSNSILKTSSLLNTIFLISIGSIFYFIELIFVKDKWCMRGIDYLKSFLKKFN